MQKRRRDADETLSRGSADWGAHIGGYDEMERFTDDGEKKPKKDSAANIKQVRFSEVIKMSEEAVPHYAAQPDEAEEEGFAHRQCRACKMGYFTDDDRLTEEIGQLVRQFSHNISIYTLIDQVYELGQHERKRVLEESGEDLGEWTREEIEQHLFFCMTDMTLFFLREIHDIKCILTLIKNQAIGRDAETGELVISEKNLKLMMQLETQVKVLLTTAPEKSTSYNPKLFVHSSKRKNYKESR